MDLSQFPEPVLECRQVFICSKCKIGVLQRSVDVNIFFICDNCGHILWNGKPPKTRKSKD